MFQEGEGTRLKSKMSRHYFSDQNLGIFDRRPVAVDAIRRDNSGFSADLFRKTTRLVESYYSS